MRRGRLLLGGLVGGLTLLCGSAEAGPEPLPAATRQRAEDAFVLGRTEDLDAILGTGRTSVDREPLAVRDLFWRPVEGPPVDVPSADDRTLSGRRIAWLSRVAAERAGGAPVRSPYPAPEAGETDPYPRLTALVRDRIRREMGGAHGLPEQSPLAAAGDPALTAFLNTYARHAYLGVAESELSEEERKEARAKRARIDEVEGRNVLLAVAGLLALVLGSALAGRRVGRYGPGLPDAVKLPEIGRAHV